ncbi:hypothetical protein Vretimale_11090, partial [Volvox reticuliferus]
WASPRHPATAPGGLAVGAFRYGSLTSSPSSSYMTLPYDAGTAVLRSSVRSGGVLRTIGGFAATSTNTNDALAQTVNTVSASGRCPQPIPQQLSQPVATVNPGASATSPDTANVISTKSNNGPTATSVTDTQMSSSTEAAGASALAGAEAAAAAACNPAFVSSSWPGVITRARGSSPRDDRAALSSLRPGFAGTCSVAGTEAAPARRSLSGGGLPPLLPPLQQEDAHTTSASTAFMVADAAVDVAASADVNAVVNAISQQADAYTLARNSAPLPMTNSGRTHGGLLHGVRFTKILAQQFAASLLLSNPASPSAVAAAAALGASVTAAPAVTGPGGGGAGSCATSSCEPASRNAILSAAGDSNKSEGGAAGGMMESLCLEPRSVSAPSGLASWLQTRVGGHVSASRAVAAAGMADYQGLCFEPVSLRTGRRPPSTSADGAAAIPAAAASTELGINDAGLISTRSESGGATLTAAGATAVATVGALTGAGAHAARAASSSSGTVGPDKLRASDPAFGSAHNAVMTILSRATVSGGGVPSVPADTALATHGSADGTTTAAVDPNHKAGQEDPLLALQSLIYKMKHLAGDGDVTDCGSESLRATARTGSTGSGSRGSDRECIRTSATESSVAAFAVESGAATMTGNRTILSHEPRTAAPPHPGNSSAAGSAVSFTAAASEVPVAEVLPTDRTGGGGGNAASAIADSSSDTANAPLAEPLPVEVLVQRAEQLRASIMGTNGLSRGCSPVPASPACSWTGSTVKHASPLSALGLCPGVPGAANGGIGGPSSGVAAVIISPVQLRYGAAIANSGVQRSGLVSVSAGGGAVSSWRMDGVGVRSGSENAGADFVFPRLRMDAVPTGPTGVRATQLRPMGDSPGPATVPQGQTMSEEEMMPEISLAGGLDQMPTGDRKSPRRLMPTALASEAQPLATAAADQPRYSVWSLVDHLPSTVASSTTSTSAVTTGSSTNTTTAAGRATIATVTAPQLPLALSQSIASATGLAASAGVSADTHVGYQALAPSASVRSSQSSVPEPLAPAITGLAKEGDGQQGGDSLAALQSLIRQVAHL